MIRLGGQLERQEESIRYCFYPHNIVLWHMPTMQRMRREETRNDQVSGSVRVRKCSIIVRLES